jgi:phosphopantetheine--protein transferase-like protein
MEEKIKNIVARFIKLPVDQLTVHTIIDRSAIGSSIMLHRMYGVLANEGIVVENYLDIKDLGTLLRRINNNGQPEILVERSIADTAVDEQGLFAPGIGIDMEKIAAMPQAVDFREDAFYKMNFAPSEIAYCILQPDPLASFAGLFAAKEALVKADNTYKGYTFNSIVIDHLPSGKPLHKDFQLSISHTKEMAIAIAMRNGSADPGHLSMIKDVSSSPQKQYSSRLLLSIITLLLLVIIFLLLSHSNLSH